MSATTPSQIGTAAPSDPELVQKAAGGDASAFEAIMRRHNRALYRTARSIVKDDAHAEECLQEAYLRAYQALPSFRAESSLSTWLTRIVINQSLEHLRKRKRELDMTATDNVFDLEAHLTMTDSDSPSAETPERAAIREETRRLLEQQIDKLPSAFRTVFVLRALEEMTVEETAACLNIEEATVRTRFFRARHLLRKSLAADVRFAFADAFAFDGERCDRIVRAVLAGLRGSSARG